MKTIIVSFFTIVLSAIAFYPGQARSASCLTVGPVVVPQDSILQKSLKQESQDFTNRCDDRDSLLSFALSIYNEAVELQEKANETNSDAEYSSYTIQFYNTLEACVLPFEKAFDLSEKDKRIQEEISDILTNVCFVLFRAGGYVRNHEFYEKRYEKYRDYL